MYAVGHPYRSFSLQKGPSRGAIGGGAANMQTLHTRQTRLPGVILPSVGSSAAGRRWRGTTIHGRRRFRCIARPGRAKRVS